jgi:hypothetical protein
MLATEKKKTNILCFCYAFIYAHTNTYIIRLLCKLKYAVIYIINSIHMKKKKIFFAPSSAVTQRMRKSENKNIFFPPYLRCMRVLKGINCIYVYEWENYGGKITRKVGNKLIFTKSSWLYEVKAEFSVCVCLFISLFE